MKKRLIIFIFLTNYIFAQQISIIGCGYVGLTLSAILSKCGHQIICFDIDHEKVAKLRNKKISIYEPQLEELLFNTSSSKMIFVTKDLCQALDSDILFVCVPTPSDSAGNCDCSFLNTAFKNIVKQCNDTDFKIICIKSTVPPGTIRKLKDFLVKERKNNIHLVYNPEFMREGSAIQDIYERNPIILGGESIEALEIIEDLYSAYINKDTQIIKTSFEAAEIIKYAWNSFSAIRITYVNELALLCRYFNADIDAVVKGFSLSERLLPTNVIKPGPGYGGSCLPKDTLSFSKVLENNGFSSSMVHQVIISNINHQKKLVQDIFSLLPKPFENKVVSILGLSFKANTNDIRYSPAITVIKELLENGIKIKAYDPKAIKNMKKLFPSVFFFESPYEAVKNVDCIIVLTEWDEIKNLDLNKVALLCNNKILIDTRNIFNPENLGKFGFTYLNMGGSGGKIIG